MIGNERVAPVAWGEARRRAADAASGAMIIEVALADAIGLVLARDMIARQPIPHFPSSAMDGWAVSGDAPWALGARDATTAGTAWPVVTGQAIPADVRGILRSENGTVTEGTLTPNDRATSGEPAVGKHIRPIGTEAARGDVVVAAGCLVNPAHVALAASCAHDTLHVYALPTVALLLTGDEVISEGTPDVGYVRDSFSPQLPAVFRMLGAMVVSSHRVSDRVDATVDSLAHAARTAQVIVTTGGTGYSAVDQVRPALDALGATMIVESIALRPGGPTMLAMLPGGQFVICLPGNPLAAFMGLLTVGTPLLTALGGRAAEDPHTIELAVDAPGVSTSTQLLPFSGTAGRATPTAWTGSAMMRGLAAADGVLVVPPGGAIAGSLVQRLNLPWRTP